MRYEIVDGAVFIYEDESETPFLFQPTFPDGSPWGPGQAEAWAEQAILAMTDPEADDAGDSPDAPTKPKYVPQAEVEPETLPE
jgi:hypothetical protein